MASRCFRDAFPNAEQGCWRILARPLDCSTFLVKSQQKPYGFFIICCSNRIIFSLFPPLWKVGRICHFLQEKTRLLSPYGGQKPQPTKNGPGPFAHFPIGFFPGGSTFRCSPPPLSHHRRPGSWPRSSQRFPGKTDRSWLFPERRGLPPGWSF